MTWLTPVPGVRIMMMVVMVSGSWWWWCPHHDGDGVWIIFPEFSGRQWAPSWRRGLRNTSVHSNGIEERDKQCTFLNQEGGGGMTIEQNRIYTIKLFLIIILSWPINLTINLTQNVGLTFLWPRTKIWAQLGWQNERNVKNK